MTPLHKEALVAARWWADRIRKPSKMNCGDGPGTDLINAVANAAQCHERLNGQVKDADEFEAVLAGLIQERIIESSWWNPEDPLWGGYYRVIGVDYHPDKILVDAYGKETTLFPIKTHMWINPGKVSVRFGYGQPIVVIWEKSQLANKGME